MDRQILKIFLPGFRIQSEILTDFRILQLQRIVNSTIFGARILDFACNKSIFAQILESGEILTADLVNKSQRISGFAYPIHPPPHACVQPYAWTVTAIDSCFALMGAHHYRSTIWSKNGENPRLKDPLCKAFL